jgi:hypothetical protein
MRSLFGEQIPDEPAAPRRRSKAHAAQPGTGPQGETCRTCAHRLHDEHHDKVYQKCGLMRHLWTRGPGTDIRAKDPACRYWKAKDGLP